MPNNSTSSVGLMGAGVVQVFHDGTWNEPELLRMARGELIDRSGKRYGICRECRTVIRLDKPLFGAWHVCSD